MNNHQSGMKNKCLKMSINGTSKISLIKSNSSFPTIIFFRYFSDFLLFLIFFRNLKE